MLILQDTISCVTYLHMFPFVSELAHGNASIILLVPPLSCLKSDKRVWIVQDKEVIVHMMSFGSSSSDSLSEKSS